jgi:hypothetical protein
LEETRQILGPKRRLTTRLALGICDFDVAEFVIFYEIINNGYFYPKATTYLFSVPFFGN